MFDPKQRTACGLIHRDRFIYKNANGASYAAGAHAARASGARHSEGVEDLCGNSRFRLFGRASGRFSPVLGTTILPGNILVMTAIMPERMSFRPRQGKSRPSGDGQPKAAVPT
jgi:hypothetical protein